jgi:hypothetical protein
LRFFVADVDWVEVLVGFVVDLEDVAVDFAVDLVVAVDLAVDLVEDLVVDFAGFAAGFADSLTDFSVLVTVACLALVRVLLFGSVEVSTGLDVFFGGILT